MINHTQRLIGLAACALLTLALATSAAGIDQRDQYAVSADGIRVQYLAHA